jgi:hypothetical protein
MAHHLKCIGAIPFIGDEDILECQCLESMGIDIVEVHP